MTEALLLAATQSAPGRPKRATPPWGPTPQAAWGQAVSHGSSGRSTGQTLPSITGCARALG